MERALPLSAAAPAATTPGRGEAPARIARRPAAWLARVVRRALARILAIVVLACSIVAMPSATPAEDARLVLVANVNSPIATLSPGEVRRLYLGIPITYAGREISALINAENATVKEMFLQHVLFMSAQAYERQLSARLYRTGGNRIPEFRELRPLVESLTADPLAVTFMQSDVAARHPNLKIVGDL